MTRSYFSRNMNHSIQRGYELLICPHTNNFKFLQYLKKFASPDASPLPLASESTYPVASCFHESEIPVAVEEVWTMPNSQQYIPRHTFHQDLPDDLCIQDDDECVR